MIPMNPQHRSLANDVLDWIEKAGNKIRKEYKDWDTFTRFFKIGVKHHRWDYWTILNSDIIAIGWKDVPYAFLIHMKELNVQRVDAKWKPII